MGGNRSGNFFYLTLGHRSHIYCGRKPFPWITIEIGQNFLEDLNDQLRKKISSLKTIKDYSRVNYLEFES